MKARREKRLRHNEVPIEIMCNLNRSHACQKRPINSERHSKRDPEQKGCKRIARELARGFQSQALCALYETHHQWNLTSD